jgi:hypothetical protein
MAGLGRLADMQQETGHEVTVSSGLGAVVIG